MSRVAAVLWIAAVLAAGCGGSPEEDVEEAVKGFVTAVADGDAAAACGYMTDSGRQELIGADCEKTLDFALASIPEKERERLRKHDPKVKVDGESATAEISNFGGGPDTLKLELKKDGGDWKISGRR